MAQRAAKIVSDGSRATCRLLSCFALKKRRLKKQCLALQLTSLIRPCPEYSRRIRCRLEPGGARPTLDDRVQTF